MPNHDSSSDDNNSSSSDQGSSSSDNESSSSSSSGGDASKKKLTPAQMEAELTRVRAEAANYRTRLRETEKKLGKAKTPEEVEAIKNELKESSDKDAHKLLVENVALKFKLPEALAARLQGSTREELEKDAKDLAKFAPASAGPDADDLHGGLAPGHKRDGSFDPAELAKYSTRGRAHARAAALKG